jgi:ribosome-binding protein aMBF1 (putative translation factor)
MGTLARPDTCAAERDGAATVQRGWVVSTDYRALVGALAAFRHECGVSQRELARRLGKPPSFINKIELFERRLDVLEFIAIAEALERTPNDLLKALRAHLPASITL